MSLAELRALATALPDTAAKVRVLAADLADPTSLDILAPGSLAGVLFGNVLHFFAAPVPLLRTTAAKLEADGIVVVLNTRARGPTGGCPTR